ncbi:Methyltransferase-like protein 17, mitochondrial [Coelomomyces lativittatus]|nr:Methyltransferase-like protein 17, mitochondrial [Coelomomyces lativittatus]
MNCPHSLECPLRNNTRDWCHFSQKMQRTPEMKKTKNSQHKGEDIKYSYLIVRKGSSQQVPESCTWSRVLTVPIKRKGHTILDVCMKEGQVSRGVVTHHEGKEIYKTVRKLGWGDQFPYPLSVVWEQRGLEREIHVKKKKETFDQKEKHAVKEIIEPSGSDSIRDNQNQKNHMRVKLGVKESPGDS